VYDLPFSRVGITALDAEAGAAADTEGESEHDAVKV